MKRFAGWITVVAVAALAAGCAGDEPGTTMEGTEALSTDTSVTMSTTDTSATGYTATDTTGTTTPSVSETRSTTNNP